MPVTSSLLKVLLTAPVNLFMNHTSGSKFIFLLSTVHLKIASKWWGQPTWCQNFCMILMDCHRGHHQATIFLQQYEMLDGDTTWQQPTASDIWESRGKKRKTWWCSMMMCSNVRRCEREKFFLRFNSPLPSFAFSKDITFSNISRGRTLPLLPETKKQNDSHPLII